MDDEIQEILNSIENEEERTRVSTLILSQENTIKTSNETIAKHSKSIEDLEKDKKSLQSYNNTLLNRISVGSEDSNDQGKKNKEQIVKILTMEELYKKSKGGE